MLTAAHAALILLLLKANSRTFTYPCAPGNNSCTSFIIIYVYRICAEREVEHDSTNVPAQPVHCLVSPSTALFLFCYFYPFGLGCYLFACLLFKTVFHSLSKDPVCPTHKVLELKIHTEISGSACRHYGSRCRCSPLCGKPFAH